MGKETDKMKRNAQETHDRDSGYTFPIDQNWAKSATRRLRSSTKMSEIPATKSQLPNNAAQWLATSKAPHSIGSYINHI